MSFIVLYSVLYSVIVSFIVSGSRAPHNNSLESMNTGYQCGISEVQGIPSTKGGD